MRTLADLEETFWQRHANPKSGWSRVLVLPVLLYAVYRQRWRLAVAAVAFTLLNPFLFSPPETDDAWMTRVVLAERWWTAESDAGLFDASYPNVLNLLNVPASGYALVAAARRRPIRAAAAGAASMLLKFWYVAELVRRYDAEH
ncbi:DUF6653 family protein [Halobaculum sp. P14]|uniref:DUF6653 family protein n=1 Tax=Halobaculum sp. P14 TaxID=3421638 RepID=UPI003EBA977F